MPFPSIPTIRLKAPSSYQPVVIPPEFDSTPVPTSPTADSEDYRTPGFYAQDVQTVRSSLTAINFVTVSPQHMTPPLTPSDFDNRDLQEQEQSPLPRTPIDLPGPLPARIMGSTADSALLPDPQKIGEMFRAMPVSRRHTLPFASNTHSPLPEADSDAEVVDSGEILADNTCAYDQTTPSVTVRTQSDLALGGVTDSDEAATHNLPHTPQVEVVVENQWAEYPYNYISPYITSYNNSPHLDQQFRPVSPYYVGPLHHPQPSHSPLEYAQHMLSPGWTHQTFQQQQRYLAVPQVVPFLRYSPVPSEAVLLPQTLPSPGPYDFVPRNAARGHSQTWVHRGQRADGPQLSALMRARTTPASQPGHQGLLSDVEAEHQFIMAKVETGDDNRTTAMIKNIPNKMTANEFVGFIHGAIGPKIDFSYLRFDFRSECNAGYAFVNFVSKQDLLDFSRLRLGIRWGVCRSNKVLQMSFATIQGKAALVEKFRDSTIFEQREEWWPKLFHSEEGPNQGQPERFPHMLHQRPRERSIQDKHAAHSGPRTRSRRGLGQY